MRSISTTIITARRPRPPAPIEELHSDGRRVRSDALPEHVGYRDTGCVLSPTCLRCPLERCRYDEPGGLRALTITPRDDALRRRRAEGARIMALAAEFGVSRRTVFRALARARERG